MIEDGERACDAMTAKVAPASSLETSGERGLLARLQQPVDGASLAIFRMLFGVILCVSAVRFLSNGWIEPQYVEPDFHFRYWGFGWVPVPPPEVLRWELVGIAASAMLVAMGLCYRLAMAVLLVLFTHFQLIDVTNYLNHYYLVVLLSFLGLLLPLHGTWSIDALLRPSVRRAVVPAWMLYLLRFQIGIVYFFAALAKFGSDWLLWAQPLNIWLRSRAEVPILGWFFEQLWVAYAMSWAGFLYDLTIVGFLLWSRTRPFAYVVVLVFHGMTHLLFDIGIFPFLMPVATLLFFPPDWPRKLLGRFGSRVRQSEPTKAAVAHASRFGAWPVRLALLWCALHLLLPLRHWAYPGHVLWGEQGMRFSWRVMVREKSGSVTFRVHSRETGRTWQVSPAEFLTPRQVREISSQPDLILQLAHHVGRSLREEGHGEVEVRADVLVSLNGRPPRLLIDPEVDLLTVRDGLGPARWILPPPEEPPVQLQRVARKL